MKATRLCTVAGCGEKHLCQGFCQLHYSRWKRHGDPTKVLCDHATDTTSLKRKFDKKWKLVARGCWEWIGSINQKDAGGSQARAIMRIDGEVVTGHRAAWMIYRGPIPEGTMVCHTCDNSICVNPRHLYLGDGMKNMEDMVKRRRNPIIKLTEADVKFIRTSTLKLRELSAMLGVSETSICAARKGRTFKFIT